MPEPGGGQRKVCRHCVDSGGPTRAEVDEIVRAYFTWCTHPLASETERDERLALCHACPDLYRGTTCRHSGCLVEVRARLAERSCPAPSPRWERKTSAAPLLDDVARS